MFELRSLVHGTDQCSFAKTQTKLKACNVIQHNNRVPATFLERAVEVRKCLEIDVLCSKMPGDRCVVHGNTRTKDNSVSVHRFLSDPDRRQLWIREFHTHEDGIKSQVCMQRHKSHHFSAGTVWDSRRSATAAHGISSSVSSASSEAFATLLQCPPFIN